MDTLVDMKLDKKKQISYRSTDDIVAKLDLAAATLASVKVSFGGAKLRTGHLVNAIALWVGEMPTDDLVRFAKPKLAALESYLGRTDDEEGGASDVEVRTLTTTHVPIYGHESRVEPQPRKARNRKK